MRYVWLAVVPVVLAAGAEARAQDFQIRKVPRPRATGGVWAVNHEAGDPSVMPAPIPAGPAPPAGVVNVAPGGVVPMLPAGPVVVPGMMPPGMPPGPPPGPGGDGAAHPHGDCLHKLAAWFCYRPMACCKHLPCCCYPCFPPLYLFFPRCCREGRVYVPAPCPQPCCGAGCCGGAYAAIPGGGSH